MKTTREGTLLIVNVENTSVVFDKNALYIDIEDARELCAQLDHYIQDSEVMASEDETLDDSYVQAGGEGMSIEEAQEKCGIPLRRAYDVVDNKELSFWCLSRRLRTRWEDGRHVLIGYGDKSFPQYEVITKGLYSFICEIA